MNAHVPVSAEFNLEATVVSPEVQTYVTKYKTFMKKTAESILGLAQTVMEAKTSLNGIDFSIFCDEIGTPENSPTYYKLLKIGNELSRFVGYTDQLPNTWTTIYKLSKLNKHEFETISADLSPFMTARDIDELLGKKKRESKAEKYDLKLLLGDMTAEQKESIYQKLNELKAEYRFEISESINLKVVLKEYKKSQKKEEI